MSADPMDAFARLATIRERAAERPMWNTSGVSIAPVPLELVDATLDALGNAAIERATLARHLSDELNAHALTKCTLSRTVRDAETMERYRVERDRARAALERLEAIVCHENLVARRDRAAVRKEAPDAPR